MKSLRITFLLILATFACESFSENTFLSSTDAYSSSRLESIPLPDAFRPEGIAVGYGSQAYVGSLVNGSIYQVDFVSGEGDLLVTRNDRVAVGLVYDDRSNYLYATGGATGKVSIYDAADGQLKGEYQLTQNGGFVNDGVIAKDAAYFTNSRSSEIYRIPLSNVGRLPDAGLIETISIGGEFNFIEGEVNANGIEVSASGDHLIIVNSASGKLYNVNPSNGVAKEIVISNGDLARGDGLLRRGNRLYVVQNRLNQIVEVRLNRQSNTGDIVRTITNGLFRIPTTIVSYRDDLFVVNARFGVPVEEDTDYDIVRVPLKKSISR